MGSISEPIWDDVFGHWPQLKTYNHGCAIYSAIGVPRQAIIDEWTAATATLAAKIPWLAQQVVNSGVSEGNSGKFHVAPWPADHPPNSLLRVKDCTDLLPSYQELHDAQFPIQMLDGSILCPVPGFPMSYDESKTGPAPACLIQLNFIKDGVILNVSNQHNVMDGTGMFNVLGMLADLLNGKELSEETIGQGNRDTATITQLYAPGTTIKDFSHMRGTISREPKPPAPLVKSPPKWRAVRFLKEAARRIKTLADDKNNGYDSSVPFISSGDAVSALYWQSLVKARVSLGVSLESRSKFSRAIDIRKALGVPTTFMGQMVTFVATYLTHQEICDATLPYLATLLRRNLNEMNTEYTARSYATFLANEKDKTKLAYGGPFNLSTDIGSSSMAQAALVLNFGLLGQPDFIRRPNLMPIPGVLYFYPPEKSGHLNLLVCLSDEEIEALKKDELIGPCIEVIG